MAEGNAVEIVPIIDDKTYEQIWKAVMADPKYRPMRIVFTPPYDEIALWVEHGTGPARPGVKEPSRPDGRTARERIGMWTESRYRGLSEKDLKEKKNDMYEQIMQSGTPPHPFIRPAIEDMFLSGEAASILDKKDGSVEEIANRTVEMMRENLKRDDHVRVGDGSDTLMDHIIVEPFDDLETPSSENGIENVLNEWEALDDTMRAKHAQNLALYKAKKKEGPR